MFSIAAAVLGMLLAGSISWMASTTIAHGRQLADTRARLVNVESSDKQIRDDIAYVRTRIDELLRHLLHNP